ncbi:hypothetical protein ACFLQL_00400 [Verrucomicrobiota bacterium]
MAKSGCGFSRIYEDEERQKIQNELAYDFAYEFLLPESSKQAEFIRNWKPGFKKIHHWKPKGEK